MKNLGERISIVINTVPHDPQKLANLLYEEVKGYVSIYKRMKQSGMGEPLFPEDNPKGIFGDHPTTEKEGAEKFYKNGRIKDIKIISKRYDWSNEEIKEFENEFKKLCKIENVPENEYNIIITTPHNSQKLANWNYNDIKKRLSVAPEDMIELRCQLKKGYLKHYLREEYIVSLKKEFNWSDSEIEEYEKKLKELLGMKNEEKN